MARRQTENGQQLRPQMTVSDAVQIVGIRLRSRIPTSHLKVLWGTGMYLSLVS